MLKILRRPAWSPRLRARRRDAVARPAAHKGPIDAAGVPATQPPGESDAERLTTVAEKMRML